MSPEHSHSQEVSCLRSLVILACSLLQNYAMIMGEMMVIKPWVIPITRGPRSLGLFYFLLN